MNGQKKVKDTHCQVTSGEEKGRRETWGNVSVSLFVSIVRVYDIPVALSYFKNRGYGDGVWGRHVGWGVVSTAGGSVSQGRGLGCGLPKVKGEAPSL